MFFSVFCIKKVLFVILCGFGVSPCLGAIGLVAIFFLKIVPD